MGNNEEREEPSQFLRSPSHEGATRRPRNTDLVPFEQPVNSGPAPLTGYFSGTATMLSTLRVAQWGVQSGVPSAFSPQEAGSPVSEIGCTQKEKRTQGESVT